MFCVCCGAPEDKGGEVDLIPATKVLETRAKSIPPEEVEESVEASKAQPLTMTPKEEPKPFLEPEKAPEVPEKAPEKSPEKEPEKAGTFLVKVKLGATSYKQLGMELDDISEKGPMIVNFAPGIVQEFNTNNPDQKIEKYDRILAVNGEGGGSARICERLQNVLLERKEELELNISRPMTFQVSMKREEKSLLGAKLTFKASSTGILIEAISSEGVFAEWNAKNSKNAVLNEDHIIAVNGESLKGRDMVEQIKKETDLTLTLLRW